MHRHAIYQITIHIHLSGVIDGDGSYVKERATLYYHLHLYTCCTLKYQQTQCKKIKVFSWQELNKWTSMRENQSSVFPTK